MDDKFKILRVIDIKLNWVVVQAFDAHSHDFSEIITMVESVHVVYNVILFRKIKWCAK